MSRLSKESQALAELFVGFKTVFPKDGNLFLLRLIYDGVRRVAAEAPGVSYKDIVVNGRPCIWIRPQGASNQHVILFMHGGGYSLGSPQGHRKLAAHLAKACNCVSLSVGYRLAPQHVYPAGLDDCVNTYKYLLDQGFKAEHIVTAGDSCSGALAIVVPLAAIQRGLPTPAAAVCLSPWYDLTGTGESRTSNSQNDVLNTREMIADLADRYVKESGARLDDPLVSSLFAEVGGLPPHWISVGGWDLLRDDGVRFAEQAKNAVVEVVLDTLEKQQHVSEFRAGTAPEADGSLQRIGEWVRKKISS